MEWQSSQLEGRKEEGQLLAFPTQDKRIIE